MYTILKEIGETPLDCLKRVREREGISMDIPMTYAGRLDPMAEGLMIILAGEECKEKDRYLGLSKVYEFEVLVGFETDTYDLLGLVNNIGTEIVSSDRFGEVLNMFVGEYDQAYPAYSSKPVDGKPLFQHAREGNKIEIPTHRVTIESLTVTGVRDVTASVLEKEITEKIAKVNGDFRQSEIIKEWERVLCGVNEQQFQLFSCLVSCESGTYVRQLVHDLGVKLGVPCVTYSIKRTKIGEYQMLNDKK
jgi:tRNA pseudouridine55 synthase